MTDAKLGVAEGKSGKYEEVVKLLIENGGIDGVCSFLNVDIFPPLNSSIYPFLSNKLHQKPHRYKVNPTFSVFRYPLFPTCLIFDVQVSPDDDWELDPTELSLKGAKMIGKVLILPLYCLFEIKFRNWSL